VSFDKTIVQPEDGVTVNVTAYKGSLVALLAVDQSVLLLKSGNDITQNMVNCIVLTRFALFVIFSASDCHVFYVILIQHNITMQN
jgi:Alpha-2-macroglobulin bait region domain